MVSRFTQPEPEEAFDNDDMLMHWASNWQLPVEENLDEIERELDYGFYEFDLGGEG